jgi:ATP-dependent helicase/nuclease subunit A
MSRIEIILAGAGTGKTTRLARELEQTLVSGQVRPEAVVATTFTRQAAAELEERARTRLLGVGRPEDAHRLRAARIGTVNAVCGRLVEQFAFELGLSPDVRVIDEASAARALQEAISTVATPAQTTRLAELQRRMEAFEWPVEVARVIAAARANGCDAQQLQISADRSRALALEVLGQRADDPAAMDERLRAAMRALVDTIPKDDRLKVACKARTRCRTNLARMDRGDALSWREWASLSKLSAGKPYAAVAAAVTQAAVAHDTHPRLHDDLLGAIELVFDLARQTLCAYEERKAAWGVIDFVDQETHALALLRRPDVAQQLREEIDLVMVDEFQDTSPLQLAIFLELAQIAPRSVWVGDQKQSIFGFRGTDPELMTATLALLERSDPAFVDDTLVSIFEQTTPSTLEVSYRSRPGLVKLTSELFVAAFAGHGMPAERVRLRPAHEDEPGGLGPIVEIWELEIPDGRRTTEYPVALAAGIDALADEADASVRDRGTGKARSLRLADIAVLSRRRATSQRVATALEALDRRVVLPRPGLLATPEGRLAMAGLRRWADRRDALAAAEIDRITRHPDSPDVWLAALVVPEDTSSPCPAVVAIEAARHAHADADPVMALERCLEALQLSDLCRRWGDARQRLGNLDALRAAAAAYVEQQRSERGAATVAGLLAHLQTLQEQAADDQAVLEGDDAVTLSTWHAAKGLEWPVTVLFDLEWAGRIDVTGVHVETDRERVDLREPLAQRWIRCLPSPYSSNQTDVALLDRIAAHPLAVRSRERQEREQLRLLYVAWTRARDRLILAGPAAKMFTKILTTVCDRDGALLTRPNDGEVVWGGHEVAACVRTVSPTPPKGRSTTPGHGYTPREPVAHPPAWCLPSSVAKTGSIARKIRIGNACMVESEVDPRALGEALHAILAADDIHRERAQRESQAQDVLQRWGVIRPGLAAHAISSADALHRWIAKTWPGARMRRELPIWHQREEGTIVRGTADLVIEATDAFAVVDHKAMLGSRSRVLEDTKSYFGQLRTYAEAIAVATGRASAGCFVHLPLAGMVLELTDTGEAQGLRSSSDT